MNTYTIARTAHTPGPWRVTSELLIAADSLPSLYIAQVFTHDNGTSGKVIPAADDNAALIVRACNAHDELVAALESAAVALQLHANEFPSDYENAAALKSVRAALAKVQP